MIRINMLENMKMLLAAASKVAISSKPIFLYKRWNKYKSVEHWAAIWDSDMFGEEIKLWTEKFGKLREVFWKYI